MRRDMNDLERPQVFICPLNINANHSTLLEINEQTKMIYHYNSMRRKSTLVQRVVKAEFKDLGFGYTEAVSKLLKTPPRTNPASSLLLSRNMGGVAVLKY